MRFWAVGWSVVAALAASLVGCRSTPPSPYQTPSGISRSTVEAEALSRQGADLVGADPAKAETLFCEALSKDLYFGPAHNNLGVLYLKQEKLYEAANEFEWARRLMPGHPDPRVNLAITLELAGKIDDALASYGAALEVYPDYLPAIQGIASLTIRAHREDERLLPWFQAIAMSSDSTRWRDWAAQRLARMPSPLSARTPHFNPISSNLPR